MCGGETEAGEGSDKKSSIKRIVESFLGCRIGSILRLQGAAVETGLYFTRKIATVGVAMMKQKLTRAIPARVQIRIVADRPVPLLCGSRVGRRENDHCPVPQAST